MPKDLKVEWTKRSLRNAKNIRKYLFEKFTIEEVRSFEALLESFELNVSRFPHLYPQSIKYPNLRKAVLHKYTTVYYTDMPSRISIIAIQDNRQDNPGK